jgi:hypothetical protein
MSRDRELTLDEVLDALIAEELVASQPIPSLASAVPADHDQAQRATIAPVPHS